MIGDMIEKIRKEKGLTKTKLSEMTNINIGHLTHIEKGERNPSHRALSLICDALDVPYRELFLMYDKELSDDQKRTNYIDFLSYNKVPLFSNLEGFIECPSNFKNATVAYKIPDDSMKPALEEGDTVFVETEALLDNKDFGLFQADDKFLIRKFLYRKNDIILRAENKEFEDIKISSLKKFKVIGKIYKYTKEL